MLHHPATHVIIIQTWKIYCSRPRLFYILLVFIFTTRIYWPSRHQRAHREVAVSVPHVYVARVILSAGAGWRHLVSSMNAHPFIC